MKHAQARNAMKLFAYLKLARISTLPTLWSNTLTAFWFGRQGMVGTTFLSDSGNPPIWAIISASTFLYLAGMVLNDFFDAKIDAIERPERVIPSGQISKNSAGWIGLGLLVCASFCVEICYRQSGNALVYCMAGTLAACIVGYDAFLKRIPFVGPICMGACRFFNILFVLVATGSVFQWNSLFPYQFGWDTGLMYPWLVFVYVTGLTILSRFETAFPAIQRSVGLALSLLIPLDAAVCLLYFGPVQAAAVLCLYPIAMLLKRIVPMS